MNKIVQKSELPLELDIMPHLLYPDMPDEGLPKSAFAKSTKPGMGKTLKLESAREKIELNYKSIDRIPNSRKAHAWCAGIENRRRKWLFANNVFEAYFESGQDISDEEVLVTLAESAGIDNEKIEILKNSNNNTDKLDQALLLSRNNFVSVVPSLMFPKQIIVAGLMEEEIWAKYIERAERLI